MMKEYLSNKMTEISIDNDIFKEYPDVLNYAKDVLWDEIRQAAEGFFHNLNTLNYCGVA